MAKHVSRYGPDEGSDNLSPEVRRRTMQAIRSRRTRLEDEVCRRLWAMGLRYRRNVSTLVGTPDIAVKSRHLVIFLDSCFWHACPEHGNWPQRNAEYWRRKLLRNRDRDRQVSAHYGTIGWTVVRVWEHEVWKDADGVTRRLATLWDDTRSGSVKGVRS